MEKKIPQIGIVTCILYFIAVTLFIITQTGLALTIWETLTIIGAPVILFVLIELSNIMNIKTTYRNAMIVFMSGTCSLTGLAHIVNITVTRKLIADGINVPNYFRIGYWPSVEMAVDYLAWGFFMGLAFLSVGLAINGDNKQNSMMKRIVLICGILCLTGFFGTIFINENLWYFAPLGYGFGMILICIKMMKRKNETD
ncbi:hypothetical protein JHL18_08960 [Clostridium sp. YIM B02505]|uniref:Uncharacterized protein n=1 Tax=Clostridium yunnanense TaxID=2800325 RepID=A0ABS1EN21_9CLOT|nr:hypothetical protein [Clostridium yunnanense]MBK1810766.1 hypothetical protein [Clostridium yunnanense]